MTLIKTRRNAAPLCVVLLITFLSTMLPPRRAQADVGPPVGTGTGGPSTLAGPTPSPNTPEALATVDLSTGTARASYPFQLPTARGEAQPSLELVYNSSTGVGYAGTGWTLNTPSIVRKGHTGHPRFQDGAVYLQPSLFAADSLADDYFMDGKLLVPVCRIAVSGSSASCSSGSILPNEVLPAQLAGASLQGWVYFRAESEDGNRYFLSANGQTWVTQTKSGHLIQMGHPLDGVFTDGLEKIDANTVSMINNNTMNPVYRWNLVRDSDASGNTVYYTWTNLSSILPGFSVINPGILYLSDIYDTNAGSAFAHHVHLSWQASSAATNPFLLDPIWRAHPSAVLTTVDVTSASSSSFARTLVRRYHLAYYPATGSTH
jgi:hypothetical protein